jgi:tRNA threonylcarbamoyladenosine biosynthesis protein TsaB
MAGTRGRVAAAAHAPFPDAPSPGTRAPRIGGALSWLALDTATDRASVALQLDSGELLEGELAGSRRHASGLLPLIAQLLERAGATLAGVRGVLLSDGPGSFTGLRVGASVAKALAHAQGAAVATAPSLMVRAAGHPGAGGLVLALSDALRGDVYAAAYRFAPGRVETVLAPAVWKPDALAAVVTRPDAVVGHVPAQAVGALERWTGRSVPGPATWPRAALLFDLRRREGGTSVVADVESWEPDYGRPAEAQARWEQTHGRPLPGSPGDAG